MKPNPLRSILFLFLALALFLPACGTLSTPAGTATSAPTNTLVPTFTPTMTSTPTKTPRPTATPNATATELAARSDVMRTEIQEYVDAGYLPTAKGVYKELPDFKQDWAKIGWYQWWSTDVNVRARFVLSAHLTWSSAIKNPDPSGCGLAFGVSSGGTPSVIFIERTQILFLDAFGRSSGRTKGTGRLSLPIPPEADFTIVVYDDKQTVFVNNEFVSQYSFSNLSGILGYSILSGTNKDYGTRCEITNVRLLKLN